MGSCPGGIAQHGGRRVPAGAVDRRCRPAFSTDAYGRVLLADPGRAGGHRPHHLLPGRRLALPGHGVAGLRRGPGDGHPRAPLPPSTSPRTSPPRAAAACTSRPCRSRGCCGRRRRARWSSPTSAGTPRPSGTPTCWAGWSTATRSCPTHVEAMRYTRTDSAAAAVAALSERVPVAVVTCGADGALAVDQVSGESAEVPGVRGGGAGRRPAPGTCSGPGSSPPPSGGGRWPSGCPSRTCARGCRCSSSAGRSRRRAGVTSPTGGRTCGAGRRTSATSQLVRRYGFLDAVLRDHPSARDTAVRRAGATLSVLNDLPTGRCSGPPTS